MKIEELLEQLFRQMHQSPEDNFKEGAEKTRGLVQEMRKDLFEVEQALAKLADTNTCEDMLRVMETAEEFGKGLEVLRHNLLALHTAHVMVAPQHEGHRNAGRAHRGPLH